VRGFAQVIDLNSGTGWGEQVSQATPQQHHIAMVRRVMSMSTP
jgi:hypothetical protein